MNPQHPVAIRLADYAPPPFVISHVELRVRLQPTRSLVWSVLHVNSGEAVPLVLDGEGLELVEVAIDGTPLPPSAYLYQENLLTIVAPPAGAFKLAITQACNPEANTALSGLYLTNGVYCTQMEAEGFRRFAFMYDRPDVMCTYQVRIEGPKSLPVLLSNGNPGAAGEIAGTDLHYAEWNDPHPKPTYLFALVAGDLASVHDSFTTMDGKTVALGIYVEQGKQDRCAWAMESLKASMSWDEKRFGRAYDLDVFNIVAVSDFNMGAMENKGLNIFNDKYILARPDTATDTDYVNIERIIAHEYFHNWTGNRITCRDWFQLCLKEGLTVYRDQEFTADMRSRAVKRIEDVITLRARQFPEDQGPLAHSVRPESYIEINNFYTTTVYEKGAELCRMLHSLIGEDAFRRAMDLYFERHDGEAATVEDFLSAMADASGRDLSQFKRWYQQAGTPKVTVSSRYDDTSNSLTLDISQSTPPTPGQETKLPFHIPLVLSLMDDKGQDLPLTLKGKGTLNTPLVELTEQQQSFTFTDLPARPRLSINRGFSAPILLESGASSSELLFLMGHDGDSFNRWDAARKLASDLFLGQASGQSPNEKPFAEALAKSLHNTALDQAFKGLLLRFPSEQEMAARIGKDVDADQLRLSRDDVLHRVAMHLNNPLLQALEATREYGPYRPDPQGTARRSLRYAALGLLARADERLALAVAQQDFESAHSMTAEVGALSAVLQITHPLVDTLLEEFYARHKDDPLLVDKWFMLQGARPLDGAAHHASALMQHPDFKLTTPNRVYALLGGFTGNQAGFHAVDGAGYKLLADSVMVLDSINPQVASRMATSFRSWRLFNAPRQQHAEVQMGRILAVQGLSRDVYEIISRTLVG